MKAVFRVIAIDETEHWSGLPEACTAVYGLYLFRVGEVTHCASLSPSTRLDFIENAFVGLDGNEDDDFIDDGFADNNRYENGEEGSTYVSYLDPDKLAANIRVSEGREFDSAGDQFEHETDDVAREYLWDQARVDFETNTPCIRVLYSEDPNIRDTVTGDLFENVS